MKNLLIPELAKIIKIKKETPTVKTIYFEFCDSKKIRAEPGQFIMVSVFGVGEAPFSIIEEKNCYSFTFRKVGKVTSYLFKMRKNDIIGIRGPFGNYFDVKKFRKKEILFVAGGVGLPPIKFAIQKIIKQREKFKRVILCYGAKNPKEILYKNEIQKWKNFIEVYLTVDNPDKKWKGEVGVVTNLLDKIELSKNTVCFVCGPTIMMKFTAKKLIQKGIKERNIFVSLERLVNCGIGICGHCNIGSKHVCVDGPVFRLDEIKKELEKVW